MLLTQLMNAIVAHEWPVIKSLETLPQVGVGVLCKLEKLRPHAAHPIENFPHIGVGGEAILFLGFQRCDTMRLIEDDRNARSSRGGLPNESVEGYGLPWIGLTEHDAVNYHTGVINFRRGR